MDWSCTKKSKLNVQLQCNHHGNVHVLVHPVWILSPSERSLETDHTRQDYLVGTVNNYYSDIIVTNLLSGISSLLVSLKGCLSLK